MDLCIDYVVKRSVINSRSTVYVSNYVISWSNVFGNLLCSLDNVYLCGCSNVKSQKSKLNKVAEEE